MHSSNAPKGFQAWPEDRPLAFGNTPPTVPLQKVQRGRDRFQDIVDNNNCSNTRDLLVLELMTLLKSRDK